MPGALDPGPPWTGFSGAKALAAGLVLRGNYLHVLQEAELSFISKLYEIGNVN